MVKLQFYDYYLDKDSSPIYKRELAEYLYSRYRGK